MLESFTDERIVQLLLGTFMIRLLLLAGFRLGSWDDCYARRKLDHRDCS